MTSIADAYVDLHVNGDNIEGEVRSSVKDTEKSVSRDFDKAGAQFGEKMAGGFLKGFRSKDKTFSKRGRATGFLFAAGFLNGLDKLKTGASSIVDSVGSAFSGLGKSGGGGGGKMLALFAGLIALVPLATSAISALTGGLVALIGSMTQAATASFAFVGVLGALIQGLLVAKFAFKGFGAAISGDEEALAKLGPSARLAAKAMGQLGKQFSGVRKIIQERVFKNLAGDISALDKNFLPAIRRGIAVTAESLNRMFKDLLQFSASAKGAALFGKALQGNSAIFRTLRQAAVPLLAGVLKLFIALQPAGLRLAENIAGIAKSFNMWAGAVGTAESVDAFMQKAFKSAGLLWDVVKNLGSILRNVFGAATPEGDKLLQTFVNLTDRLRVFTDLTSTQNAIAEWAQKGIEVSGILFKGLGKGFLLIKDIFDPNLVKAYIEVFKNVLTPIIAVVKAIQGALTPVFQALGKAFADNGPKFAALFEALEPLLRGIGAVLGQVFLQAINILGGVAAAITPVVKILSNLLGPILEKFAPIIAAVLLSFVSLSARFVAATPLLIRPFVMLVKWAGDLLRKLGPALRIIGKLVGFVFKGIALVIGTTLRLGVGIVRTYFNIMSAIIGGVLRGIFAVVKLVWSGIVLFVKTYLTILRTVVTTGFNAVRTITTTVFNAVRNVIVSVWNAIANATKAVWNSIKGVVMGAVNGVKNVVTSGFTGILNFIKGIPDKILGVAASFLSAGTDLGKSVINGLAEGLKNTGGFLADIGNAIKNKVNDVLNLPVTIGKGFLKFTIPAFARGTNFAPGGMSLVGERGPELVNLPRGSQVKTAAETRQALTTQPVTLIVNNPEPQTVMQSIPRAMANLNFLLGGT